MACDISNLASREGRRNERVLIEIEEGHTLDLSLFQFFLWKEIQFEKDERSFLNEF